MFIINIRIKGILMKTFFIKHYLQTLLVISLVTLKNIHIASNSIVMQVVYKGEGNIFTVQWSTEIGVT